MSAAVPITNASRSRGEIPGCIAKLEPDAEYGWFSNRRLLIAKGDAVVSLSADDLRHLFDFVEANTIEAQI
jgi:hypothetical protein